MGSVKISLIPIEGIGCLWAAQGFALPDGKRKVVCRRNNGIKETGKPFIEIGAPQRHEATCAFGPDMNNPGLTQFAQMVAERRLGAEVQELATGHGVLPTSGKVADDRQPRLVAQGSQHIGQDNLVSFRMGQVGHEFDIAAARQLFNKD